MVSRSIRALGLAGLLLACCCFGQAQSFIGFGAGVTRSSAADPSPARTGDGGAYNATVYVEAGAPLPLNLEMRLFGSYGLAPELPTIFTRDEGSSRKAYGEFRVRPELRLYLAPGESKVRPFVAGGVEYFRQRFNETAEPGPLPDPLPAYVEHSGPSLPASGLNPFASFGVRIGKGNEVSFSRLFPDNTILNASRLEGYRASYTFTRRVSKRLSFKLSGEADYVTFREASGFGPFDADPYRERDAIFRIRVGIGLE